MKNHHIIEALLFDLGGVVIDIDFERAFRVWERQSSLTLAEIRSRFTLDAAYEQHERGEIESSAYFAHLRNVLSLAGSDEAIIRGWNAIYVGEITETLKTIRSLRDNLPCYAFTNSNDTHQRALNAAYPKLTDSFDRIFVSSELGLRKPERAAFDAVVAAMAVAAPGILFFDDSEENVKGARAAGLQAVQVKQPSNVRKALVAHGVISK